MEMMPHEDPLESLRRQLDELKSALVAKDQRIADLERHVEIYRKIAFGKLSEKRKPLPTPHDPRQQLLFTTLMAEAQQVARRSNVEGEIEQTREARPKKKATRRTEYPEHVPHFRSTYRLPESELVCECGGQLREIGVDVSKELERIETTIVHEIARTKYACPGCGSMAKTAPGPDRVIERGLLGPGFLAHVIVERFLNHMPYHRQEKKYESEGLDVSRSVLERSASRCAEILSPIADQIRKEVLATGVVFTDDTPVTVSKSSAGGSRKGRIWTYCDREDRHFYDFTESRTRDGPAAILRDYIGFAHADAYPGYDALYLPGGVTEVGCWAHARRGFDKADAQEPELAREGLRRIQELYAVERAAKEAGLSSEDRRALRQQRSKPLLEPFREWMDEIETRALPKGALMDAIRYVRNQWKALNVYLTDGRLEIDNNRAERAIRPFAIGRNNWMFFETPNGGHNAAIHMTLVRTAQAIGLNPKVYLRDVLTRVSSESDITKLTPHGWKEHFADEVARDFNGSIRVFLGNRDELAATT